MGYLPPKKNINIVNDTKVTPDMDKGVENKRTTSHNDVSPADKSDEEIRRHNHGLQPGLPNNSKRLQNIRQEMTPFTITPVTYTDIDYVNGVLSEDEWRKQLMCRELYKHCKQYFDKHFSKHFFTGEYEKKDIFQNAFVKLWENIEQGKIYVEDGILKDKGGMPHVGSLTTYLMGIAKIKYLEWGREEKKWNILAEAFGRKETFYLVDDNEEYIMLDIISECISHMSKRCSQILSMYWYEDLDLKEILKRLPTYHSINALKTEKYKCMKNLRQTANEMYIAHTNS